MSRIRVAALVIRQDQLLFAEHTKGDAVHLLLPGGGVDPGESLPEALERELMEEIGVRGTVGDLVQVCEVRAPDGSRHTVQMVFETRIEGDPESTGEDPRVTGVRWLGADAISTAPVRPDLRDWLRDRLGDRQDLRKYREVPWQE